MSKQDRQAVRTAQDLERKYDFSGIKKAIEMNETGINKINKTLENFTTASLRTFTELKSELDDAAEIWFYGGKPTLETLPASEWTDYEMHLGDLYYDKETGFGYRFKSDGGVYSWEQIEDRDTIYALALADTANDTKDGSRKVYTGAPKPPYGVGDLYIDKKDNLYVCQVARAEGEEYELVDFIEYEKYVENTVLVQGDAIYEMSENMTSLSDTVVQQITEITATCDSIILAAEKHVETGEYETFKKDTEAELLLLAEQVSIKLTELIESIENVNGELQSQLNAITQYFTFDVNGMTIGQSDKPSKVVIDEDIISILMNGSVVQSLDAEGHALIPSLQITKAIDMFGLLIDETEEGRIDCGYIGGDE